MSCVTLERETGFWIEETASATEPCREWDCGATEEDTYGLGAMCRYPTELTLFKRFFKAAKADDWGKSIKSPYRHLYKYGYFSGSSSCSRRSRSRNKLVYLGIYRGIRLTCKHRRLDQLHQFVDLDEDIDRHLEFGTVATG